MNFISYLLIALLWAPPTADDLQSITLGDGQEFQGQLVAVADGMVSMEISGELRAFPLESVRRIRFAGTITGDTRPIETRLVDGSLIRLEALAVRDGVAGLSELAVPSGKPITHRVQTRDIDYLGLIRHEDQGLASQFDAIRSDENRTGDRLVFARESQLDYVEGVIGDITDESIGFHTGDREVEAQRSRISGVVYFHPAGRQLADPVARVSNTSGSRLNLYSLSRDGDQLLLQTVCGAEFRYSPADIVEIDFSSMRFQYLSEMEPTTVEWQPLIFNQSLIEYQTILNRPRFDQSFRNEPLELQIPGEQFQTQSQQFERGIAVKGGTRLVFALHGQYRYLTGWYGFAPYAAPDGLVEIVIQGDGHDLYRAVWNHQMNPPQVLEIPVEDVGRLTVIVHYHDGRNIGDVIHFCDLKVSK